MLVAGKEIENLFLILTTKFEGRAYVVCYVSKNFAERSMNAGTIVKELGKHIQGGGGGQPFFATAGGKNPEGIPAMLEAAAALVE